MRSKGRVLMLVASAALFGCISASTTLDKGKAAPATSGTDAEGKSFDLDDFKGKVVLLDFWASY